MPMLWCVSPLQANYVIQEIHMGACSMHLKARSVVAKAIRQGYYWPTMHRDAREEIRKCDSCQIHSPIPKLPKTLMTSIMAPWPFFQWGMDVLGTLPEASGKIRFVIIAMDYFTKWIKAKPLAKTTGKEVKKFVWDNIINTAVAHPQAVSGLVERANRSLIEGIKTRLGKERQGWVNELPNVLWAHRTSLKTSNDETPYVKFGRRQKEEDSSCYTGGSIKMKLEQYLQQSGEMWRPMSFKVGKYVYRKNEASRVENLGKLGPK
ncbi:reverse transcriptase domain-containing protein [Tanacetum coccineum]|uniref:Reverse transcriptase domain-containing protein n=1 Tax=Tanacetum coccineum TaxID=301880 RepID=A0ABQ5FMI4_9ASTR